MILAINLFFMITNIHSNPCPLLNSIDRGCKVFTFILNVIVYINSILKI